MRADKLPKITIVTPSYNQGKFLEETILSVLNQDYPNLEYIIIDGGSTDNSIEVIRKYEDRLAYWVSEPDRGQSDAINKGFHKSSGNILHWLNSDDLLVPGALFNIANYFSTHPEIGCVMGDLELIDANGNYLATKKVIPFNFNTALYSACMVPQPAAPFTRWAWEKTGDLNINLRYQMDFEYYLRMAKVGIKFGILKKPVAQFRYHKESKTVSEYKNLVWKSNRIIQDAFLPEFLKKLPFKNKFLEYLNFYYRFRSFIIRGIYRREWIPFRATKVRLKA